MCKLIPFYHDCPIYDDVLYVITTHHTLTSYKMLKAVMSMDFQLYKFWFSPLPDREVDGTVIVYPL